MLVFSPPLHTSHAAQPHNFHQLKTAFCAWLTWSQRGLDSHQSELESTGISPASFSFLLTPPSSSLCTCEYHLKRFPEHGNAHLQVSLPDSSLCYLRRWNAVLTNILCCFKPFVMIQTNSDSISCLNETLIIDICRITGNEWINIHVVLHYLKKNLIINSKTIRALLLSCHTANSVFITTVLHNYSHTHTHL